MVLTPQKEPSALIIFYHNEHSAVFTPLQAIVKSLRTEETEKRKFVV